jgi:hypothetical protein
MPNDSVNIEKDIKTYLLNCNTVDYCNYSRQNKVFNVCLLVVGQ